jgi:UDP-glucose 4-epimerase
VRALNLLGKTIQCESLNIGSGVGVSNLQIVKEVARHTGAMDLFMADRRPGDPDQLVADISRTKELLNWKPEHSSIDNIVRSAVQWYKQTNKKEIN